MNKISSSFLTKKRRSILIASCIINLCIGSLYSWSVFSIPFAERLSLIGGKEVMAADLSIVFTIANAVGPITMISGGMLTDKFGVRKLILFGGLAFGIGFFLCGNAKSINELIAFYGIVCGLALGLIYGCTTMNTVKFFPEKRGLIGGITTASYGISSVLVPPIANYLIERYGITSTFRILGIILIVAITISSMHVYQCPSDFVPDGMKLAKEENKASALDKTWKQMLKDRTFYVLMALLMCGAVFGLMVISMASPIAQTMVGMSASSAAVAVSTLAFFNASGRVLAGTASDKLGRINTLAIMLVFALVGLVFLYNTGFGENISFLIGISIIGFCFGSFMSIFPGISIEQFGARYSGVNYGILFIGFAIGGYVGPSILRNVYSVTRDYHVGFLYAMLLAGLGLLFCFIFMKMKKADLISKR